MLIIVVTGEASSCCYTVLFVPFPHIAKDGTTSGPGPEPPPMDISTRAVVHQCDKTARCSGPGTRSHASGLEAGQGTFARASAKASFLCLISCRERSHPTDQDDGADETREKERKGKRKKKKGAPDNHMRYSSPKHPDKRFSWQIGFIAYVIPPRFTGLPRILGGGLRVDDKASNCCHFILFYLPGNRYDFPIRKKNVTVARFRDKTTLRRLGLLLPPRSPQINKRGDVLYSSGTPTRYSEFVFIPLLLVPIPPSANWGCLLPT